MPAKYETIQGGEALARLLDQMPKRLADKIQRQTMRAATNMVKDEIVSTAPVGPRKKKKRARLKSNIAVRALKRSRTRIGYRTIIKNPELFKTKTKAGVEHFYPTVVEYGSAKRNIPPHPFIRPAFERTRSKATAMIREGIIVGINQEVSRVMGARGR